MQHSEVALKRQRAASYSAAPTLYLQPPVAAAAAAAAPAPAPAVATVPPVTAAVDPVPPTQPSQEAAEGGGTRRELPAALKAKLAARGILRLAQATATTGQQQQPAPATYAAAAYAVPDESVAPVSGGGGAAEEPPLPPGWFCSLDPTYHRVYFYNPASGERTWERPAPGMPAGWAEAKDPASGITYYYNAATGEEGMGSKGMPLVEVFVAVI